MITFPVRELYSSPSYTEAEGFNESGAKAVFYDSIDWKGKKVKVFAWIGIPEHKKGEKVPGIVLVHGGGGTAFADWVRLWTSRGYAAIAIDTCGGTPAWSENSHCRNPWPRHEFSGPHGWGDSFNESDLPEKDQWPFHAVAAVVRAHSLLRSFKEVDADKIGITGISWGGVLTCISAGVDKRFAFAAPVYGCGHLEVPSLLRDPKTTSNEAHEKWLKLWNPSIYLKKAEMPFLWMNGTNDFAFPIESTVKSINEIKSKESHLAMPVRMIHAHGGAGENPPEILNFANKITGRKHVKIPEFGKLKFKNGKAFQELTNDADITKVELNYTRASGFWCDRFWNIEAAFYNKGEIIAPIPEHCTAFYFNVYCGKDLIYSSVPTIF